MNPPQRWQPLLKEPGTETAGVVVRGFRQNQLDEGTQRVRVSRDLLRLRGSPASSTGGEMSVGPRGSAEQGSKAGSEGSGVIPLF